MALLWLESVNSLYDWFTTNPDLDHPILLGWGGETLRETHNRVAWGDGDLDEGSGEFDSEQKIYIEGWVHDEVGSMDSRRAAYTDLAALLRKTVKAVYQWRDLNVGTDVDISIENHSDAFAPDYGFQLTVNVTQTHICRIVDNL